MQEATVCHLLRGVGDDTQVLLGKRASLFMPGIWNGPGGKFKNGETVLQCVRREVFEEIGVKVYVSGTKHIATVDFYYPCDLGHNLQWRVHFLLATRWKGEPKLKEGFSELRWFDLKELPYQHMPIDQKVWLMTAVEAQANRLLFVEFFHGDSEAKTVEKCSFKFVGRQKK